MRGLRASRFPPARLTSTFGRAGNRSYHFISWVSPGREPKPQEVLVPSLAAAIVASLAGWIMDGLLEPFAGPATTFMLSFAGSTALFFLTRRWLITLRGR